ncbi:MAG: NAD(P)/FAD-dependent oxidoreductase [Proteobacteria bacterium]|nr:NAD(P)/FAD-dependent oxidoreductase [Pseudomonadota bacterium]
MSGRIAVIGGGHNGLTAAAFLARAGRDVVVVEARPVLGGLAARENFHGEFFVPGLLHHTSGVRRRLIEELDLGRFGLTWCDPPDVWAPAKGGSGLWLRGDCIEGSLAYRDDERFAAYRAFIDRVRRAVDPVMDAPPADPKGRLWPLFTLGLNLRRLGAKDMVELLRIGPMSTFDWMHELFQGERLRAALAASAIEGTFAGPRSPGSAANLLIRECTAGAEVQGGPASLISAVAGAARSHGAEIRTHARVSRITVGSDSAVTGIEIDGGEVIRADIVVASCDPKTVFLDLIGSEYLPARLATDIGRIRTRGTTAKVHLAISGSIESKDGEPVEALRTGESLDDLERAFDAAKYGEISSRPVLDVRVPSLSDPDLCPEGHHVVSILAHFAARDLRGSWNDIQRETLGRVVIETLAEHVPGLSERIVAREILSPIDIESHYGVSGGHIYHGEHAPDQLLFMRPTIQCAKYATPIRGLFLCGSGSHPGGGITCGPGALAAKTILGQ